MQAIKGLEYVILPIVCHFFENLQGQNQHCVALGKQPNQHCVAIGKQHTHHCVVIGK